jgi:hypothetical protein
MLAWDDRMADAEIQAIVGFIRQWGPTAPEVAVPVRTGQGGPPWVQSQTTTTTQSATLDWCILALVTGGLAIAFTLILMGYSSLRKTKQIK